MTAAKTETVRARVTPREKAEAVIVLDAIGLTMSDAFRLMIKRIAAEKALPFGPLVPNKETIAAINEARSGKLRQHANIDELMKSLNEED